MSSLDDVLFEALNSPPDYTRPDRLSPGLYGDYAVEHGKVWRRKYRHFDGLAKRYEHEDGEMHGAMEIAYDRWQPAGATDTSKLPVIVLTHGVPVNRHEWYAAARILARFAIVYTVDLLGMGQSSKPLDFPWEQSWDIQAHIFTDFLSGNGWYGSKGHFRELQDPGKSVYLGGNDWGGGVVQRAVLMVKARGLDKVKGYILGNPIALNGYWVQQIGALRALAEMPFKHRDDPDLAGKLHKAHKAKKLSDESYEAVLDQVHPMFRGQAEAFVGSFTSLLESMHHRTPDILNQYSLAPLQAPYVEVSAYYNVGKNPSNTVYNYHAIRVLAQQANLALGNGLLLPHHSTKNPAGIKFSEWERPVLVMWGAQDKMMPAGQLHRFENIAHAVQRANPRSRFFVVGATLQNAGHFAASDQPEQTADAIIRFVSMDGVEKLHHAYFGLTEIARQDEQHLVPAFEALFSGTTPAATRTTEMQNMVTLSDDETIECEQCEKVATAEFDHKGTIHFACSEACARAIVKK